MTNVLIQGQDSIEWLTLIASFVGVLLGGGLTFWTTWHFEKRKRRDEIHGKAYSIVFKCRAIAEEIAKYRQLMGQFPPATLADGNPAPAWMNAPKPVGLRNEPITFEPSETVVIAQMLDDDLLKRSHEIENIHRIFIHRIAGIIALREEYQRHVEVTAVRGIKISQRISVNSDTMKISIELDSLAENLDLDLSSYEANASKTLRDISLKLKEFYNLTPFVTFD